MSDVRSDPEHLLGSAPAPTHPRSFRRALRCIFCGAEYEIPEHAEDPRLAGGLSCPRPACVARHRGIYGSLEVVFDYDRLRDAVDVVSLLRGPARSLWDYAPLLPAPARVTLGEGATPLLAAPRLRGEIGLADVWLKNEGSNPTGSFKDRESAVAVARALEVGATGVTCVSSGNAAASLAAYAARAGLRCLVFTPAGASIGKRTFVAYMGARGIGVDGAFEDVWELVHRDPARDLAVGPYLSRHWYDANPALNPYRSEGDKTTAYEIVVEHGRVPDWVFVPVGNGSHLVGLWKGFRELRELGVTTSAPRMVGVQVYDADPVTRAWKEGADHSLRVERPADSLAEGTVAKDSYDAPRALAAIRESSGRMASAFEGDTLDTMFALARREGILTEPTSATVLAAGKEMVDEGLIARTDDVVFVLTGNGLKTMETLVERKLGDRVARLYATVVEPGGEAEPAR
ncbi:MAG TPA: threonine synthase [Thermoplasmata archaeon]|nr:threonine synthase [Thermoplasmata archaeon]